MRSLRRSRCAERGVGEKRADPSAGAMQSGFGGLDRHPERRGGIGDAHVLERQHAQQRSVLFRQPGQRSAQLRIDQPGAVQRDLLGCWRVPLLRQLPEEVGVATAGAGGVAGHVRGGHQQPWQHRPLHDPDGAAATPQLQEHRGGDVLGVGTHAGPPKCSRVHPGPVHVEQGTERRTITTGGPGARRRYPSSRLTSASRVDPACGRRGRSPTPSPVCRPGARLPVRTYI